MASVQHNPGLDALSDLWIRAELADDADLLFTALWTDPQYNIPGYFFRHYTPNIHHRIQHTLGFVEDPEDALMLYWIALLKYWRNVVPYPPLIYHSLHYYARSVVRHQLDHAQTHRAIEHRLWRLTPRQHP